MLQLRSFIRCTMILIACIAPTHITHTANIYKAAKKGDYNKCKYLINNGTNINAKKCLHIAACHGHYKICKLFIEHGSNINSKNYTTKSPLHLAALAGHYDVCKLLINNCANIHIEDEDQRTPLHDAAYNRDYNVCKLLIENGSNINSQDYTRKSPLHLAACDGRYNTCKLFIENGASPHIRSSSTTHKNITPRDIIKKLNLNNNNTIHLLRLAEEIHDNSQLPWQVIRNNNLHTQCAKIALAIGQYDLAKNMLDDAETYATTTRAELLLHAEQLRPTRTNTQQLDRFIHHILLDNNTINFMLHVMRNKVNNLEIAPIAFKHVLERYRCYINGHFNNINADLELTEHRALRDIICKRSIHETATRIHHREATHDEIAACLTYAGNEIGRYRDNQGNTVFHNIMHNPSKWPFIMPIARLVMDRNHGPYNIHGETPYMIARNNNNTPGMQILADYHKLNSMTECRYATKLVQPALLQIAPSSNSTWPLSTIGSTCRRYLAETPSTYKLPSDIKWDILEIKYGTYHQ